MLVRTVAVMGFFVVLLVNTGVVSADVSVSATAMGEECHLSILGLAVFTLKVCLVGYLLFIPLIIRSVGMPKKSVFKYIVLIILSFLLTSILVSYLNEYMVDLDMGILHYEYEWVLIAGLFAIASIICGEVLLLMLFILGFTKEASFGQVLFIIINPLITAVCNGIALFVAVQVEGWLPRNNTDLFFWVYMVLLSMVLLYAVNSLLSKKLVDKWNGRTLKTGTAAAVLTNPVSLLLPFMLAGWLV